MKLRAAASGVGTLVIAVAMGCGDLSRNENPAVPTPASVEEVYARMTSALRRDGQALHTSITVKSSGGNPFAGAYEEELWLDAEQGRARRSLRLEGVGGEPRQQAEDIIAGGGRYSAENGNGRAIEALTCHESDSPILSTLLGCHGYLEKSNTWLGSTETFKGRQAIVVVTEGESRGEDEKFLFTDRLYVDARTWLPLALETSGTVDYGKTDSYEVHARYQHDFIDAGSLPADFFEPSSIGYVERDPAAGLAQDVGMTVYWLGREFDPGGRLPKLALRGAHPFAGGVPPGYRATVEYADAANKYGPPIIGLQEFPRAVWDAFVSGSPGGNWWEGSGVTSEEIALTSGRAVIFRGPGNAPVASSRFLAHVYLGDTVILVDDFDTPSAYSTVEGMRAIAEGLQPYR